MINPNVIQERYYAYSANKYDNLHSYELDFPHKLASNFLFGELLRFKYNSILDIGAGTGNLLIELKDKFPHIIVKGIEPVQELRKQGYKKGLTQDELIDGNGYKLSFSENCFDIVCAFGVLHHIQNPKKVIDEMLRVASKAIFISDSNNFGQGNILVRSLKQIINFVGLWKTFDFIATRGKGYHFSEGDGIFYSYSVFNNYKQLKKCCKSIHLLNTAISGQSFYRSAPHIAILGIL